MTRKRARFEQLTFARLLGGLRKGGGRKKSPDSGVPHLKRAPVNRVFGRSGEVFADRYHDRVLSTPREIYNVLRYLFDNARKHGMAVVKGRPDPYSSGLWFDGWKDYVHDGWIRKESPVARAVGWLLNKGWRRYGLLELRPAWDRSLNFQS